MSADLDHHVGRHLDQFRSVWLDFSGTVSAKDFSDAVLEKIKTMKGSKDEN
jgi:hypothetical protein